MSNTTKLIMINLIAMGLTACGTFNPYGYTNQNAYVYQGSPIYPESYESEGTYTEGPIRGKAVVVPQSYHVSEGQAPISFKDKDKMWLSSQNPQNYTIELADDEKATNVASKVFKAPKDDHSAQMSYTNGAQKRHLGVYGTFKTKEEAELARQRLPEELRNESQITQVETVQKKVGQDSTVSSNSSLPAVPSMSDSKPST